MRRSKEIVVLFALLAGAMAFVLWYVIDRRAKNRAAETAVVTPSATPGPAPSGGAPASQPAAPAAVPVDLALHERKTIDFTSGQPVVKDSAEDQAAIDAALKDMAEATKGVTFGPTPKPPAEKKP